MTLLGGVWTLVKVVLVTAAGWFGGSVAWTVGTGVLAGVLDVYGLTPAGFSPAVLSVTPFVGALVAVWGISRVTGWGR